MTKVSHKQRARDEASGVKDHADYRDALAALVDKRGWIRPYVSRYRWILVASICLGVLAFLFAGGLMFTSGAMISMAAALPFTVLALHLPSIFVRIFGIGKPILSYFERLGSHDWVLRMTSDLRRKLYDAFDALPYLERKTRDLGSMLGMLDEDIAHLQNLYLRSVFPLACAWIVAVLVVITLGVFSWQMAAVLAIVLGIELIVVPLVSVCVNGARLMRERAATLQLYTTLTDTVFGITDWVCSGRKSDYLAQCLQAQNVVNTIRQERQCFDYGRRMLEQVLFGIGAVALALWAGWVFGEAFNPAGAGVLTMLGNCGDANAPAYPANWIAAFVLCYFPLLDVFVAVPDAASGLIVHGDALRGLQQLDSAAQPTRAVRTDKPSESTQSYNDAQQAEPQLSVRFDDVSFSYPSSPDATLRHINLAFETGSKVTLIGRSGSGKSTLINLLAGSLKPTQGKLVWGEPSSQAYVGLIEQNPHIFNQTLRENLIIGRLDATDEEMLDVLYACGLKDVVARLPHGLDTVISEGGFGFSGGERHRIALARVLLSHASIIVLDEPFCALDPATEDLLLETILKVSEGRTLIMATHHLRGIASFDRVILLKDGEVSLDGAPQNLKEESAYFARLMQLELQSAFCDIS